MKKIQLGLAGIMIMALFAFYNSHVSAEVGIESNMEVNSSVMMGGNNTIKASATSEIKTEDSSIESEDNATSSDDGYDNNDDASDNHGKVISAFVKSLLAVADREGGIGAEVRVIAHDQEDSEASTSEAMAEVEDRNSFKTFLIGSDFKNIGILRSESAKTKNNIEKLKKVAEKVKNPTDKVALEAQVKVLTEEQIKIENFVNEHESSFSLFGWFVKLFNK